MAMSECDCGQVEIPLGLSMCNLNGTLHGVTACVDKDRWEERALEAEAAIARVRELHVEGPHQTCMVCATWKTWADGRTDLLGEPWPCSTIRILDGDSDE